MRESLKTETDRHRDTEGERDEKNCIEEFFSLEYDAFVISNLCPKTKVDESQI